MILLLIWFLAGLISILAIILNIVKEDVKIKHTLIILAGMILGFITFMFLIVLYIFSLDERGKFEKVLIKRKRR